MGVIQIQTQTVKQKEVNHRYEQLKQNAFVEFNCNLVMYGGGQILISLYLSKNTIKCTYV